MVQDTLIRKCGSYTDTSTPLFYAERRIRERTRLIEKETAIEKERVRIARDMHDDLGARVTQISVLSEIAKQEIGKEKSIQSYLEEVSYCRKPGCKYAG